MMWVLAFVAGLLIGAGGIRLWKKRTMQCAAVDFQHESRRCLGIADPWCVGHQCKKHCRDHCEGRCEAVARGDLS